MPNTLTFNATNVYALLQRADIDVEPSAATNQLQFDFVMGQFFAIRDSRFMAGQPPSVFVLLPEDVDAATLNQVTPVLKAHKTPSGFRVQDALFYRQVYYVGLTLDQLKQMVQEAVGASLDKVKKGANITFTRVPLNGAANKLDGLLP